MIFAELPLTEAEGAILAHGFRLGKLSFKKGRVLSAADVAALAAAGGGAAEAGRLEPGDVPEDAAAARVAAAARGANVRLAEAFTGRCNLFAEAAGLLVLDRDRVDAVNLVDEALTVATLAPYEPVEAGRMVATVKIIPFAVPQSVIERCAAIAAGPSTGSGGPLLRVATFRPRPVGLVQTRLPGTKESVLDKTVAAVNDRLAALGCPAVTERRCAHETAPLAEAIAELASGAGLLLVSGASAITDRRDVVPAAIEGAGGRVDHFGMPVDPGNLLLLAHLGATPVLGLPGCARSPKLNGFDWVLQRLLADVTVSRRDIMLMGAGGLLMEIPTRPQPRARTGAQPSRALRVGAVVLAAG
ncbi:MAG: molybdopterin-binding protein, partial [Dongiaceae bacterium]